MSQQNWESQHLEQQQKEEENGHRSNVESNSNEWAFNCADSGNGNALRELELKMTALETKNRVLSESLANVTGELGEKLREVEEKAQMSKNELEEFIVTSRLKEEELANVIAILNGEEQKEEETTNSNNTDLEMNLELEQNSLADGRRRRIPLPLELNCQIFECLKFGIQRKFIGGLGRGIYGMFRQKVLAKQCRKDNFPGTVVYYFEVTQIAKIIGSDDLCLFIGLSDGNHSTGFLLGITTNSYGFGGRYHYYLAGEEYRFELSNELEYKDAAQSGNVYGCGILLNPQYKVSIFFTLNGKLLEKQIPISPSVDCLYPTVEICNVSVEANFGTDPAKPFDYDFEKCPGMGYDGWQPSYDD